MAQVYTMERPTCVCRAVMVFFMDTKTGVIWQCPECGWLLYQSRIADFEQWYQPVAKK